MRTKTLAVSALSLLVALVLAACGSSTNEASSNNTTSTSEAESPVGDQSENEEFCRQFAEQMQSVSPELEQMSTTGSQAGLQQVAAVFTELATDAPTEIQPQFETVATALDAVGSGDQQKMMTALADMQGALGDITTFMSENCTGVDMSALGGIGGGASAGGTTTP